MTGAASDGGRADLVQSVYSVPSRCLLASNSDWRVIRRSPTLTRPRLDFGATSSWATVCTCSWTVIVAPGGACALVKAGIAGRPCGRLRGHMTSHLSSRPRISPSHSCSQRHPRSDRDVAAQQEHR